VFSLSSWSVLILFAYVGLMYSVYRYRAQQRWTPSRMDRIPDDVREELERTRGEESSRTDPEHGRPLARLGLLFVATSLLVLVGGWFAAQTADVLAEQTGLGDAFLGATLLAIATSLPEMSTTIAAARNHRYTVAVSNVFGSNAFDVMLIFVADALYREGAILEHAEMSLVFVAAIGAFMTCIYLWGMLERENRSVFGIGWDSAATLLVYVGAMAVLYRIT